MELDEEMIGMYDQMLSRFGYERLCGALEHLILDRDTNDPFPSIKQIRAVLDPKADPEQLAILAANAIQERIVKDGWTNPERARERMGELAWSVVQASGGWESVCRGATDQNKQTSIAQWTKLAKAKELAPETSHAII